MLSLVILTQLMLRVEILVPIPLVDGEAVADTVPVAPLVGQQLL